MPFTFIGVYVCLTDFILQNKETRNHPSRPPPQKKKKGKKSREATCLVPWPARTWRPCPGLRLRL